MLAYKGCRKTVSGNGTGKEARKRSGGSMEISKKWGKEGVGPFAVIAAGLRRQGVVAASGGGAFIKTNCRSGEDESSRNIEKKMFFRGNELNHLLQIKDLTYLTC